MHFLLYWQAGGLQSGSPLGGLAQLGEHLPCTQKVIGSIPIASTKLEFFYTHAVSIK